MLKIYKVTVSRLKSVCTQTASMWIPRLESDFASSILSNPVRLLQAKRIRNSSGCAYVGDNICLAASLFIYYAFNQYKLHIPKQHADDFLLCNCSCKFMNLRPSLGTQGRYILLCKCTRYLACRPARLMPSSSSSLIHEFVSFSKKNMFEDEFSSGPPMLVLFRPFFARVEVGRPFVFRFSPNELSRKYRFKGRREPELDDRRCRCWRAHEIGPWSSYQPNRSRSNRQAKILKLRRIWPKICRSCQKTMKTAIGSPTLI